VGHTVFLAEPTLQPVIVDADADQISAAQLSALDKAWREANRSQTRAGTAAVLAPACIKSVQQFLLLCKNRLLHLGHITPKVSKQAGPPPIRTEAFAMLTCRRDFGAKQGRGFYESIRV